MHLQQLHIGKANPKPEPDLNINIELRSEDCGADDPSPRSKPYHNRESRYY